MSAGDFVRWCKQLIDLLGQIAAVPSHARVIDGQCRRALGDG